MEYILETELSAGFFTKNLDQREKKVGQWMNPF